MEHMRMTEERKALFLAELARHGVVARAARAASPHSENGCAMSFRDARREDPDFAVAWEEAMEQARGALEFELHRRAVEGWEEPIYGGRHKEKVVGTVRRYSDRLLELRAKALLPEYRERRQVELGGGLDVKHAAKVQEDLAGLSELSPEAQDELRALLERAVEIQERDAQRRALPAPSARSPWADLGSARQEQEPAAIPVSFGVGAAGSLTDVTVETDEDHAA
jgi:hypothetical protein